MLGMCPTLATTTSAINGLGMGLSTTAVLMFSNMLISALRKIIPDRVRIPAFIVVVASLVTIVQLLIQGYVPSLYDSLGIYIPLIVVNCIILGRAEAYASKNGPVESFFDGVGMGLGFTCALTIIGMCRELLGAGAFFGHTIIPEEYHISILVLAPGAFFVLAMLTAIQNKLKLPSATNGDAPQSNLACGGNCLSCSGCTSSANHMVLAEKRAEEAAAAAAAKKAAAEKALAAKKAADEAKAKEEAAKAAEAEKEN
jgi:electron transport complex protein RnfE